MAAQRKRKAPPTRGEILKMTGKELKSLMRAHKAGSTIGKKDVLLKRVLEFFEMPPLDEGGDLEGSTQPNVETAEGGEKAQLDEGNGGEKDADAPDADAAAAKANDAPTSTPGTPGQFPDVESEENAKAPGEGEAGTGVAAPPETPAADTPKGKRKSKGGDSNARKISELSSEELGALESAWRKLGDDPSKSKRKEIALKFQVDVKSATKHFKKEKGKGKRKSNVVTAPAEEARAEPPSQQQQTRKISEISAEEKEILMRAFRTSVEASNGVPSKENKEGLAEQLNVPVKEVNQFFAKQRKLAIGRGDLDLSQPSSDKKRKEKKGATADETDDKPGQSETETIESSKKKRKKKDKDENKPKRAKSAYNFFLTQKRSEVKEKYPELDNTAAMKQLGIMWKEASDAEKAPFEAMAKKDKIRYEKEKEAAAAAASKDAPPASAPETETVGKSKNKSKKDKDENKPKRGKSSYLFFCDDKRSQLKEKNPELSMPEMSKQLGIMWKEASDAEKAPFEAMAKKDKIRYEKEKETAAAAASRDAPPASAPAAKAQATDSDPTSSQAQIVPGDIARTIQANTIVTMNDKDLSAMLGEKKLSNKGTVEEKRKRLLDHMAKKKDGENAVPGDVQHEAQRPAQDEDEGNKKKRKKKDKDENKPKRGKSAYILFVTQKRGEVKEKYPELDNTAAMKQLGIMWKEASDAEKAPFEAMAKKDKIRYEKEKETAAAAASKDAPPASAPETETVGKSKKKSKKDKDENKPKRGKSSYLFFCDDKRSQLKEKNPELSMPEMSKQLGIMWKEASDAEKAPFEAMAKKDKIRYEKEKESNIIQSQPQPEAPVAQAQPTGDGDEGTEAEEPQPFPPRGKKARKKKAKKGGSETAEEDRQIVSSKTTATDLVVVEKQKESANKRKRVQQGKSDKSNYTCTYASFQETYLKGCAWSPCGVLLLSASNDKCMRVYDMPEGAFTDPEPKTSPKALKESVKFSVGGPIYDYAWYSRMQASVAHSCFFAVTSQGSPIQMIDGARGQLLQSYKLHNDADELVSASSLCFHPGGEVLVGGFKGSVATWRLDRPGKEPEGVHSTAAHGQSDIVKALDFGSAFPDLLACGAYDGMVGLYDLKAGWTKMDVIGGHAGGVTQVQFSKDGNFLYSGARRDGAIHCWDIRNLGAPYYTLTRPGVAETNQCIGFDILPMGSHLASGSTDGSVLLYDLVSGDLVSSWKAAADAVNGVSFHPYATLVATASGEREFSDSDSEAEAEAEAGAGGGDKKSLKLWRPASSYQVEGWQSGIARRLGVQLE